MKFNFRIEDLELRSCRKSLVQTGDHTTAEIIKWQETSCFTLAYWTKDTSDDFDLKFVGNRPFKENTKLFIELAEIGQALLEKIHTIKQLDNI